MKGYMAAGLAGLLITLATSLDAGLPANGPPTLLPDTGGAIRQAVVAVNSARRAALRNADLVSHIVNGLPPRVGIDIVTNDRAAFTVANNPWPERVGFIDIPANNPITIWTQDPFLVLRDRNGTITLLGSRDFERAGDDAVAAAVAESLGLVFRQSSLYFEGGNIVSDTETIFVGANTIRHNAHQLGISEEEVAWRFEQELGRPVLVVGPYPQPIAHIDMMLTPLGDQKIALADPGAGADIARTALETDPEAVSRFESTTMQAFFGHHSVTSLEGPGGETIEAPDLSGRTARMIELGQALSPVLDQLAEALTTQGYQVSRVPMLYGGPGADPEPPANGVRDPDSVAEYPMLTYNNVLLEKVSGEPRVYLPEYGWPELDSAAADAWRQLGFMPLAIPGLATSSMYGGALRCSVKVLARDPG